VFNEEQKKRLLERLDDHDKYWKAADVAERAYFEDYRDAYEAMPPRLRGLRGTWCRPITST